MKNWKAAVAAAALSVSMFGAGAVSTVAANAQTTNTMTQPMRNEWRSNHNIRDVRRRLERIIDSLQRDQRDYGGHRVAAIRYLQQARQELTTAEQYDAAHPGM